MLMSLNSYTWSCEDFTWIFEPLGNSPILITVPHDRGFSPHDLFGFLDSREKGVKGHDDHVWPIARDILLKTRVNAVRGLLPRHFIDYNRSPEGINYYPLTQKEAETAFDNPKLRRFYDLYHLAITKIMKNSIEKFGLTKCLLLDFHGFTKQPPYGEYDLILGTGNRITMNSDTDRRLASFLADRNYRIFLPAETTVGPLEDRYAADFTTRHYAENLGIDAIQIEIAAKYRNLKGKEIGQKLSADIAEFLTSHYDLQT